MYRNTPSWHHYAWDNVKAFWANWHTLIAIVALGLIGLSMLP